MRRLAFVLVLASVACGGGAPTPVVTPIHATEKPATPAVRARWVFSAPEHEIAARLDLGNKRTLYVGEHGRRELDDGGTLQHASTLAEEALGGVMRDDKGRYVFVAVDGDTYVSAEPLGALERVRPPRTEPLASVTTGRAAIVGVSANGVMRSTDFGATWKAVDYGGAKLPGRAVSVALDSKGNGVLLHLPQRLFATHDDGATWTPLASSSRGAASVLHDGTDRLFTIGYHDLGAILTGDKLVETTDAPSPIFPGQPLRAPRVFKLQDESRSRLSNRVRQPDILLLSESREPLRLLAGDRVVELAYDGEKKSATTRTAPLGDTLGTPTAHPDLDADIVNAYRVAAWNGELVHARTADDDDESDAKPSKAPTTTILRSKDYGATWQKEDALEGVPADNGRAISVGPRGWTYVGPLCPSHRTNDCKAPKVRPAGKTAYETLTVDEGFAPRAFVFDEAHDKVYALGEDGGVFEGALDGAKLTRTMLIDKGTRGEIALTLDATGTLRAFERMHAGSVTLHERTPKGEDLPLRYLDIGRGTFAFVGNRGLMIGNHESYETSDAGDTWTRVPSNGATRDVACSAAGCLLEDAARVGWDLPAVQATNDVRASTTEPSEHASPPPHHPTSHTPPLKLTCKVAGKGATLDDAEIDWVDGSGPVRWAHLEQNYMTNVITLVDADKDAVHRTPMLAADGDAAHARTATDERDDGMVAARYRFTPRSNGGSLNPVRVELVWWSPSKGQVHRGTLPSVKPFRVSRSTFSGRARVVDGGLVFQGSRDDVIHFVHDDGKTDALAAPGIPFDEVWHSGKRWVLVDTDGEMMAVVTSEDDGKTWAQHAWSFGGGMIASHDHLETLGGKPMLRALDGLYEISATPPNDPPVPIAVDASTKAARCESAAVGSTIQRDHVDDDAPVVISVNGTDLTAVDRVFHDTASGKQCTSVYVMEQGRDKEAYLYADKNGAWSGWYAHPADQRSVIEPFTCK